MFFSAAKMLSQLERPGDALLLLLALGAALLWVGRLRRAGILLVTLVTAALLAIWILPVAGWVTAPLENRFARPPLPAHVDGLIVLGGAVDVPATLRRGIPALNGDAERMTEFVRLAKLYPNARLVFSGGSVTSPRRHDSTEASVARLFFRQQGLDVGRVRFEDRSRDTYENVLFSKALVRPRPGEVWVLVASARDVPRCMGVFRRLGWPVIAMPVSYKADRERASLSANLRVIDDSMHEWLGLLAYRLAGRTDALFPGPQKP